MRNPNPLVVNPPKHFGQPPTHADGWTLPTPSPFSPKQIIPKTAGSQYTAEQVAEAKQKAFDARAAVANRYNYDNDTLYAGDLATYQSDIARWNAINATILAQNQMDYNACFNDLSNEYQQGVNEGNALQTAYDDIGQGDFYFDAGEASTDLDTQMYDFMQALSWYTSANTACSLAESYHAAVTQAAVAAEGIMANYGG